MGGYFSTRWGGHRKRWNTTQLPALHLEELELGLVLASGKLRQQRTVHLWVQDRRLDALQAVVTLEEGGQQGTVDVLAGAGRLATLVLNPMRTPWGSLSWYVNCPRCARRVRRVYFGPGSERGCRRCRGVVHPLAQLSKGDRAMEAQRAARLRLGGEVDLFAPFPERPRYMRWADYWAALERDEQLWLSGLKSIQGLLQRYEGRR